MFVLGIESTAHTFGVAVVKKTGPDAFTGWEILANERKAFTHCEGQM